MLGGNQTNGGSRCILRVYSIKKQHVSEGCMYEATNMRATEIGIAESGVMQRESDMKTREREGNIAR